MRDLRVDEAGAPCIDGLAFRSEKKRVLVLGAPREVMLACAGLAPIVRGSVVIEGETPARALALGRIAVSPQGGPMPRAWSPLTYVEWSARLAGVPKKEQREVAETALAHVGLAAPTIHAPMRRASILIRRSTQLAAALVPAGATLVLWDPFADLAPEDEAVLAPIVTRALGAVRGLIFASRAPWGGPLAKAMEEVVVVAGSAVVAQGPIDEVAAKSGAFLVRAAGDVPAFVAALEEGGASVSQAPAAGGDALFVELGAMDAVALFRAAARADAVVIELRPMASQFS